MKKIINHFTKLLKQSEKSLDRSEDPGKDEMSEWHRGFYSAEIRAYKHAIDYLKSQCQELDTVRVTKEDGTVEEKPGEG